MCFDGVRGHGKGSQSSLCCMCACNAHMCFVCADMYEGGEGRVSVFVGD